MFKKGAVIFHEKYLFIISISFFLEVLYAFWSTRNVREAWFFSSQMWRMSVVSWAFLVLGIRKKSHKGTSPVNTVANRYSDTLSNICNGDSTILLLKVHSPNVKISNALFNTDFLIHNKKCWVHVYQHNKRKLQNRMYVALEIHLFFLDTPLRVS